MTAAHVKPYDESTHHSFSPSQLAQTGAEQSMMHYRCSVFHNKKVCILYNMLCILPNNHSQTQVSSRTNQALPQISKTKANRY